MDTPPNRQSIDGDDNIQIGKIANSNVYINTSPPPPDTPITPHQIPSPPPDFVGREQELDELTDAVLRQGKTIIGVHGLGGIGKTALVYKLADWLAEHFPGGSIKIELNGTDDANWLRPEQALVRILQDFLPTTRLPEARADLLNLYRSVLDNKRVILLLDNARDAEQVKALLPPPRGCLALITSRTRFYVDGFVSKHLEELPEADAVKLLLEVEPRIGAQAAELARLCGYLPLALRISAGQLRVQVNLPPGEYCKRLSDETRRLDHLDQVRAALEVSYQMLPAPLQEKWRKLGVFAADFAEDAVPWVWGTITNETTKEQDESASQEASDILGKLIAYSLIVFNDGRYRLHDLARLFSSNKMSREEAYAARLAHAKAYKNLLSWANRQYEKGGVNISNGLAIFDRERREINAGQVWAASATNDERERLELVSKYPNAGFHLLSLRLHPRERIAWLEAGLNAARALGERRMEGYHLGNLGSAYYNLGDARRAIELYEQYLTIAREIGDRRGEGNALGNLGLAYADLGDARRAIEYHEQALIIDREIGDRRGEGNALGNLGSAYYNLGDSRRTIEFYEQQLVIAREISDRRGVANASWNLGWVYEQQGNLARAVELMQVLVDFEREIGHTDAEKHAAQVEAIRARMNAEPTEKKKRSRRKK